MNDLALWIKQVRTSLGLTQVEFGDLFAKTKGNISAWENGRHSPNLDQLARMSTLSNLPLPVTLAPNNAEPAGKPRAMRPVKIKGFAKLGDGGYYEEMECDGWVDSYSPDPDAYGLRVKGDSMHPAIRNGSVVVIEPNGRCVPTEYVAIALLTGQKMVKELVVERADEVVIESVNGNHRQTIEKKDIAHMHPVAAVVSPSKWRAE